MNINNRQEIINLMPWYNLGKLSDAEKAMVDEALTQDPALKEQLTLEKEMMSKVVADPKILDKSAFESNAARLNNVLSQIDDIVAQSTPAKKKVVLEPTKETISIFAGVKSFFTGLLTGNSHSFTYAVFATLTVVQLGLLMFFVAPSAMQDRSEFITSSAETNLAQEPVVTEANEVSELVLLITVENNLQVEGFTSETLGEVKLEILPSNYGYYRVRINKKRTPEEIEVLKNELSHKTSNVIFVGQEF